MVGGGQRAYQRARLRCDQRRSRYATLKTEKQSSMGSTSRPLASLDRSCVRAFASPAVGGGSRYVHVGRARLETRGGNEDGNDEEETASARKENDASKQRQSGERKSKKNDIAGPVLLPHPHPSSGIRHPKTIKTLISSARKKKNGMACWLWLKRATRKMLLPNNRSRCDSPARSSCSRPLGRRLAEWGMRFRRCRRNGRNGTCREGGRGDGAARRHSSGGNNVEENASPASSAAVRCTSDYACTLDD